MKRTRVAVVGCGNWGGHIVRDLVSLGCEVVAVARSSASREKATANGASTIVPRIEDAVDRVFVMHKWRYHPGIEMLADVAAGRELGAVVGLDLMQVGWGSSHRDVDAVWILAPH